MARFRLPGTGIVPIAKYGKATPWPGGIFNQPPLPAGRSGIFRSYWAIPPRYAHNDTGVFYADGRKIPGSVMDCGRPLDVVGDALGAVEETQKSVSNYLFGPIPAEDPRDVSRQIYDARKAITIGLIGLGIYIAMKG